MKKYTKERELNILFVDISASGNFGSGAHSKRELAAEIASLLAFSAIRNSDKVGLLVYTDRAQCYLPPKKGRRHVLRVLREILYHHPLEVADISCVVALSCPWSPTFTQTWTRRTRNRRCDARCGNAIGGATCWRCASGVMPHFSRK